MKNATRVLIVDDSALVRKLLTEILESDDGISVVGTASDPYVAREKIKQLKPDVLTLDVEMPRMDGLTFLGNLMRLHPMPVVMVSSLTEKGADTTLRALELGAIDFVSKPKMDLSNTLENYAEEIVAKLKTAANARIVPGKATIAPENGIEQKHSADVVLGKVSRSQSQHFTTTESIIAVGASTGGTEAIRKLLSDMPASSPGTVITQHIPVTFSAAFAARANSESAMQVCHAQDGQQILPGHAYIAPGDQHLMIVRNGARYHCKLSDGPPVNRHKPAVDVLFRSAAQNAGPNSVGVLLTGMGDDGAAGLKEMQEAGAPTIAQDEKSSVVWGMPGAAVKLNAADKIMSLDNIAGQVADFTDDK
ncbi:MAG: chemotaxis response regulator protein-glutamate methylesterase [Halioglobus sp.]